MINQSRNDGNGNDGSESETTKDSQGKREKESTRVGAIVVTLFLWVEKSDWSH